MKKHQQWPFEFPLHSMIAGRLRRSTRTTSTRMRMTTQHLKDQILHRKHWKGLSRIYKSLNVDLHTIPKYTCLRCLAKSTEKPPPLCCHKHYQRTSKNQSVRRTVCRGCSQTDLSEELIASTGEWGKCIESWSRNVKVRMQLRQLPSALFLLILQLVAGIENGGPSEENSVIKFVPKVSGGKTTMRRRGESKAGECTLEMFSNNSAAYWACR